MTQSTIVVRRWITVLLLLVVTAGIVGITIWTAGKSYAKVDPLPFENVRHLLQRVAERPVSTRIIALIIVPIIANILLFVPFGFLLFISLYTIERPTLQTYVLTFLLGFTFACAIEAWQYFLPSRVADINDIIWNTAGTFAGAVLAHLRMRVRFEFD
jgi:glycopeptide antibiotics resistance protein